MLLDINYYCVLKLGSGHRAMTISEIANIIIKKGKKVKDCWIDTIDEVVGFSNDKIYVKSHYGVQSYNPENFSLTYLAEDGTPFRKSIHN